MSFFTDEDHYTGPPLTRGAIRRAQWKVGLYKLPAAYLDLLREKNGGEPKRPRIDTEFPTEPDGSSGVTIEILMGIGATDYTIDDPECSNRSFIKEWDLPKIGVVFCQTEDHGHDAVMFDYRTCGRLGEPSVAYVGEDRRPRTIAANFTDLVARMREANPQ